LAAIAVVVAAGGLAVYQYDTHKVATSSAICAPSGPYTLYYDQDHNPYALNADRYGGGTQCPTHNIGTAPTFTVTGGGGPRSDGGVEAYPNLIRGCSFDKCYSPTWPKLVSTLPSWSATSHFTANGVSGKWNANYDLWFNRSNSIGPSRGAEILINFGRSYSEPTTNFKGSVSLGGSTYDVFSFPRTSNINGASYTWTYVQYWRKSATYTTTNLNLNQFMNDAAARGLMSRNWYWTGIDSGFEIWSYGSGLWWGGDYIHAD
jgi:hypothetical protein